MMPSHRPMRSSKGSLKPDLWNTPISSRRPDGRGASVTGSKSRLQRRRPISTATTRRRSSDLTLRACGSFHRPAAAASAPSSIFRCSPSWPWPRGSRAGPPPWSTRGRNRSSPPPSATRPSCARAWRPRGKATCSPWISTATSTRAPIHPGGRRWRTACPFTHQAPIWCRTTARRAVPSSRTAFPLVPSAGSACRRR